MFAALKELSGFFPAVRKKNPRNLLNAQENAVYQLHILNCINERGKITISSLCCFYVKLCNRNLWKKKITCHTHIILRNNAFRVLKQNSWIMKVLG